MLNQRAVFCNLGATLAFNFPTSAGRASVNSVASFPRCCSAWLGLNLAFTAFSQSPTSPPPKTERHPVTDAYHGVQVSTDYRWLEEAKSAAVVEWTRQQNGYTRTYLDRLPARAAVHQRLQDLSAATSPAYLQVKAAAGRVFALKRQPPLEQPLLVSLTSPDVLASEKVLLDPNTADSKGTIAIEGFYPSPDGTRVAVVQTIGGTEQGDLTVMDAATGQPLPDRIERVAFATGGGSVAWEADGRGFYYTRYPRVGERPAEDLSFYEQLYLHRLGTTEATDTYVLGKEFPRIGEVFPAVSSSGQFLLVTVQNGDGGDFAHWLRGPDFQWRQLTQFPDGVKMMAFGPNDQLFVFSKHTAPRGKILRMPAANPVLSEANG